MSASRNDPFFFFKLKSSLKDPLLFIVLTKWPTIFLLSSMKDPLFSLLSLSPKDPYFGSRVHTYPSLPYVSAPPPPGQKSDAHESYPRESLMMFASFSAVFGFFSVQDKFLWLNAIVIRKCLKKNPTRSLLQKLPNYHTTEGNWLCFIGGGTIFKLKGRGRF